MASSTLKEPKMRFGVILLPYSVTFSQILGATTHAERLGFDSIWISDHLQKQNLSVLECWSTISALASVTKKIRFGSLATCNSFRNPSLLAKIVSTASDISNGRIDLAIGLGYDETEHEASGLPFWSYRERVERLAESVQILNSLWSSNSVNFAGKFYNLKKATSTPKPRGVPRLWVAGRNKNVLEIACKYAYGANILPYSGTLDGRKLSSFNELERISQNLDSASSGRKHFGKSIYCGDGGVIIGSDNRDYANRLEKFAKYEGFAIRQFMARLENLSLVKGTTRECASLIREIKLLGFEELMLIFPGWQAGDYTNMELFAKEFIHN